MKKYLITTIAISILFISTSYAKTPMYSTEVDQGLAKMFNKSGLVDGIYWSGGQITRFSDIGGGSGNALYPINLAGGTETTGILPLTQGGHGSNTAAGARTNLGLGTLATQDGTFSGTSSGTNTGDQTISLTGDIIGTGTGSFATTIAAGAVALGTDTTGVLPTTQGGWGTTTPNFALVKQISGTSTDQLATNLNIAGVGTDSSTMRINGVDISPTEKSYNDGLTGNIQAQLNAGLNTATSSTSLAALITDETGTGSVVFAESPTINNPTLTGNVTMPGNETHTGSKTVTTGNGYDQTYTVQGAGTFTVTGSGSTKINTTGGIVLNGSLTVNYSSMMNSARIRPFVFVDFITLGANSYYPLLGNAISNGAATNPNSGLVTSNHPGVIKITGTATANSGYRINSSATYLLIGGGEKFEACINMQAASATTWIGFWDTNTGSEPADGVYLALPGTLTMYGKTANNSTRGTTSTNYTLGTNTWYRAVGIVGSGATRVDYYLYDDNGALLWTDVLTTNIPTATGREVGAGVLGVTQSEEDILHLDYFALGWLGNLAR